MAEATFKIFRGDKLKSELVDYQVPIAPGMVVLDALHYVQGHQAPDLAVRWNCKAGKCGSCSAEVNGRPRLTCKTRLDSLPVSEPITVQPMKSFPAHQRSGDGRFLELQGNKKIPPFTPRRERRMEDGPARRRSRAGVSQVYRVFSLSERLSRVARS